MGEDVRQHKRTKNVIRATISALSILTVTAVLAAIFAFAERNSAQVRAEIAMSEAEALQADDLGAKDPATAALLSLAAWQRRTDHVGC